MAISKNASTAANRSNPHRSINEEINMKPNAIKVLLLSSAVAGLAGMSGIASAQLFSTTATVQNAVNITQTTAMTFGTVFATKTSPGTTTTPEDWSRKLTLAPAGTIAAGGTPISTAPSMLALSGAAAGVFTAPNLPSNATVNVAVKTAANNTFTQAASVDDAVCNYDTPALALAANKIVLQNGGDPTTAFFCVDVFASNRTGLIGGAGYALGFGVTTLDFNLGATLVAQTPSTTGLQRSYAAGDYTGSFNLEIVFP